MEKSLRKSRCPIHNWSRKVIDRAIAHLRTEGNLSMRRKHYPLTLRSVHPELLRYIIAPIIPSFRRHSLVLLGEGNVGKTPLAIILAFALARYWVSVDGADVDPEVSVAPDMDFFRGDPGTKYRPFIYDDGDAFELPIRKLKAFLDVAEQECMTRERWGASKFVKNQWRSLCDNTYDPEPEIQINADFVTPGSCTFVSLEIFRKMCGPMLGHLPKPHVMALFKRAHFIVNSKRQIYLKKAGEDVVRVFAHIPSYLTTSAGEALIDFKERHQMPSAEQLRQDIDWEQTWVNRLTDLADGVAAPARKRFCRGALALPAPA